MLAFLTVIAIVVLGYVGRWLIKGYQDLQARVDVKEGEYKKMMREMSDQVASVNRDAINKLHEVSLKVAEVVTSNTEALDGNADQTKEMMRIVDAMERTIQRGIDTMTETKKFIQEQRDHAVRRPPGK